MPRVASLAVGLLLLGASSWLACAPGSSNGPDDGAATGTNPVVDCTGLYGTTPSPDGTYYITAFGCYTDASGATQGDPGDNCIPGCLSQAKQSLCSGMSGPACEETVNWYSADSGRYGCMTRLKVTNPANGKSVVVVVLDAGPACFVEQNVNHAVLDMSTPSNLYLFGSQQGQADHALVDVVVVDGSTPLGPTSGSASSSSSSGSAPPACSVAGVAGTCLDTSVCAAMTGYVSTPGHCPGASSEQCCTPSGASSSSSSSSSSTSSSSSSSSSSSTSSSSGAPPPTCQADGVAGTCIDVTVCAGMAGYTSTPGDCPGPSSEQCCTPPPSCSVGGVDGICIATSLCASMGETSTPGYCPGSSSEQCCTP